MAPGRSSNGADRIARLRRRREWSRWLPFQLAACAVLGGGKCPYHADPAECGGYRQWARRASIRCVPVCYRERETLTDLADNMVRTGVPGVLAMFLAGAFLKAGKGGDSRLLDGCLKQLTALGIENVRARARAATAGKAEGEGLDGYMQLLAGAPGGAA